MVNNQSRFVTSLINQSIKTHSMKKVVITKNGKVVKEFSCNPQTVRNVLIRAIDIAGGMWNGTDTFKVKAVA
jgi:hypothetical protein